MYILSETNGQTCNKFFQYLYYLKLCIQTGQRLRIQLPDATIEDYPNLRNNPYISFPFYSATVSKIFGVRRSVEFTRLLTVLFLNNYCRFIIHQLTFHKICFLSGKPTWIGSEEKYSDIRDILNFLFELRPTLKEPVDRNFDGSCVTCGIHMRGGDYRRWMNGKYFFEQTVYREAMDNFARLLPEQKIRFFICSNEPVRQEIFRGTDYFTIDGATASQDIYALSKCDYIIGPLSSFNAWASLVGRVPLFTILEKADIDNMALQNFSPVVNYKEKENGWKFPRNKEFFRQHPHPWLYRHSNKEHLVKLHF